MDESAETKTGQRRPAPLSLGSADTQDSDGSPEGGARDVADRYGRYVVLSCLGAGGMGEVFAAWDPELDRRVALKRLKVDDGREGHRARLIREAQAMARLRHPNVVAVHDVGSREGEVFIAMEFVDGQTLRQWAKDEHGWQEIVDVYVQAARGLAAAHAEGLVHRDFKPDNAMVDREGRVQVLDFGLVAAVGDVSEERRPQPDDDPLVTPLTATGTLMGTPAYMAPEAFEGGTVDARSDQFALCVGLFEALHGHRPFAGSSFAVLHQRVTGGKIERASDRVMPPWLEQVVRRGLSTEPGDRFASMDELIAALVQDPGRARRRKVIASMGALTIAAAVGAAWWIEGAPQRRCADADAPVAEVWNDARRAELATAFQVTELPFAADNWAAAEAVLFRRATALGAAYREACRATHVERIQSEAALDQRRLCLDGQRRRLDALLDVLTDADEAVVSNAVSAVETFDDPGRCTTERAILGSVEGDSKSEAVDALRKGIDRADALRLAGKHGEAHDAAQTVVPKAREVGDPHLLAMALAVAARCAREDQKLDIAETLVHEAYVLARELDADGPLFEALLQRFDIAQQRDRHEEGLRILDVIRADARRAGRTDLEPGLDGREGLAQHGLGKYVKAIEAYERALEGYEQRGRGQSVAALNTRANLAATLIARGETDRSIEIQEGVVAAYSERFGDGHPLVAAGLLNLGSFINAKQPERALSLVRKAVAIREAAYGFDHPLTGEARERLASVLLRIGKAEEAEVFYRDAVERMTEAYGEDSQRVSLALNNLAGALWYQNEIDEAIVALERSLEIKLDGLPADHPDLQLTQANVGLMHTGAGNADRALGHWEAVLSRAMAANDGPKSARARTFIAYNLARKGERARAREVLDQIGGPESIPSQAKPIWYATLAVLEEDPERAAELANDAIARIDPREGWLRDQLETMGIAASE